jgi:anaerobic selenocysteine-containing dehydrogenase
VYQEGQPRRLDLQAGDQVRVPNPRGEGHVKAVVVTPAEPGRKVRIAWVRYLDGPEAGELDRVDCSYIQPV